MTPHQISAFNLSAGYGEREIINSLDLDILPGKITVIIGPNTCGKSTLFRTMSRPQGGQVLLDEPTTFLDITHQVEVLDLLCDLIASRGTTIVMVLHDLNLAARYGDHLIVMAAGRIEASGTGEEALTEANLRRIFGLESRIITDPTSGRPIILPIGRHRMV